MTGRELIVYILANGLEDEQVFSEGKLIGYMTAMDAAIKYNVGLSTIKVWINSGLLEGIRIGDEIYIPANVTYPIEGSNYVNTNNPGADSGRYDGCLTPSST